MRSLSDCFGDMVRTRIEDREIEYVLSRQATENADGLASLLAQLDLERLNIPVDDRAAEFAVTAAQLVPHTGPPARFRRVRPHFVPRLATAALAAVLVIGLTGVAVAADGAAPGDALYGLDRALERIGINDGGIEERLVEANSLADNGQTIDVLNHLAEVFDTKSPNAADALEDAAERVAPQNDNPSQAVLEDVGEMLEWMADTDTSGSDFGQGVAERAKELGAGQGGTPPATAPDGPPDNPGKSGDANDKPAPDTDANDGSGNSGADNAGGGGSDGDKGPPEGPPGPPGR